MLREKIYTLEVTRPLGPGIAPTDELGRVEQLLQGLGFSPRPHLVNTTLLDFIDEVTPSRLYHADGDVLIHQCYTAVKGPGRTREEINSFTLAVRREQPEASRAVMEVIRDSYIARYGEGFVVGDIGHTGDFEMIRIE
jgi:hypothetical protein